ncbi:hypothetical protein sos41_37130 [Alphaproteobacteria bacterium SO-S41]|nr:hypothetical protein sos41_37130 [Alphaproteobacteria bacterium SO-S41]
MSDQTTTPPPALPRRPHSLALRIARWTGIVLLAIIVLITGVLLWPGTREWAFNYGRSILDEAGVKSSSITGDWTEMTLHDVAITDAEGTWATADEVVLSWSPWGLASFTLDADHVAFKGAHVLRAPAYTPAPDQKDEPFAWPDLPVDITLGSLVGDITIDPSLIGEAVTATVTGKAELTSTGGSAELALTRSDGVAGEASVSVKSKADLGDIALAVNAKDARIVAALAGDPRLTNLEVALQATRTGTECTGQAAIAARDGALASLGVNPDCTFALTLAEVARLLPPDTGLSGQANLSVQLREDGSDKTTHFLLAADLSKLMSTDAMFARLLPGASATGLLRFTAGGVRVDDLQAQLGSGTITLTGWAEQTNAELKTEADLASTDLAVVRPDLKGSAQAHLTYDTAAATPIAITATGENVVAGGLTWPSIALQGAVDGAGTGQVSVKGDGETPIDLVATIAGAFGDAPSIDAKGVVASANITAKTVPAAAGGTDLTASIDTQRLDRLGAIAGVDVAGSLKADLSARLNATPEIALTASIAGGRYGGTPIGDGKLSAKGPLASLAIELSGTAPAAGQSVVYRLAAVVADFNKAQVSALSLKAGQAGLDASGPFTVAFASGVMVDGLDARLSRSGKAAGRIVASAAQGDSGVKTTVALTGLDLEALTAVLGRATVKGLLDANATLDGGAGRATLDGRIAGLRAGSGGRAPPADIALKGSWNGGRFTLTATATANGLPDARAEIAFPLARAADGGFPSPATNAQLTGSVSWSGRIAPIWRLVDIDGQDLDGDANIQAKIAGTLSDPKFSGSASLANGRYANDGFGTRLAGLSLKAEITGDRVTLNGEATDGAAGRMAINMAATLGGGYGAASGGVTLTSMQLLAQDELSARFNGSLKLAPGANGPVLGGALTVTNLVAGIPEGQPADLVTVDVIDPAKPPPPSPTQTASSKAAPAAAAQTLALDISVVIPGPAKVEGRGINSLWKGDLKILGDATDPRIRGKLTLLRGTLDFGSRSFALTEGEIEFDGGPTIEPRINIVATQEEADFTASLTLSGRATAPKITASSVPARPQDEVFAALLFGRSVSSLSALEGLELANSIAALSGGADVRGSVLGDLRNKFGLDVLAVDLGEGGNPTVRAGSYLADNIYFELRQGGANGGTTGRVELQIDENISVETEVGPQSSSSVGARYKLDY